MMKNNKGGKARFRLRTILIIVNLTVLILPLVGVLFFRFYENELVRQTEIALNSEASVIAAIYKQNLSDRLSDPSNYGLQAKKDPIVNRYSHRRQRASDDYYTPVFPKIDLSEDEVLPPRPDGIENLQKADKAAVAVGEQLSTIIMESQKVTLSGLKVLDYQGIVVAGRREIGLDFSAVTEVQQALLGQHVSLIRQRLSKYPKPALASISRSEKIRVFVAFPILKNDRVWGVVYLSRTPQNIAKHLYANLEKIIIAAIVVISITMLLTLFTSYMISRPLNRLIEKTRQFAAGDLKAMEPVRSPRVKEIELLADSFLNMTQSLADRADYIRDFALNVSHEFKTPITSIQGSAELLLEHLDDMEESVKRKFLSNIIADSDRLKRLITRLLELAKADNFTPGQDVTLLQPLLVALKGRYKQLGLDVGFDLKPNVSLIIECEHMKTVLSNLCDNALQSGASTVTIDVRQKGDQVALKITDNGPGISPANRENIFNAFYTTKRLEGGTGLGLKIIRSLLEAHGGSVDLMDSSQGACFQVMLPVIVSTH